MLDGLKRWFTGGPPVAHHEWEGVAPWAESQQYSYRGVQGDGFVVDGRLGATPWRLEWGPSQRPYISGQELRVRSELGLGADLQLVVMNRVLQEQLEKSVYEQYVQGVQTRIDNQAPPEMRWLVLFSKLVSAEAGEFAALRERYVALGSQKPWLAQWLSGALTASLKSLRVEPGIPVVLMIGRGRLMLRTALEEAQVARLQIWLRLFETAMLEARRVANERADASTQSTQPSHWSPSALPGHEHQR